MSPSDPDRSDPEDGEVSDVPEGTLVEPDVEFLDIPYPALPAIPDTIDLGSAGTVMVIDAPHQPRAALPALWEPPPLRAGRPPLRWLHTGGVVAVAAVVLFGLIAAQQAGLILRPSAIEPNPGPTLALAGTPGPTAAPGPEPSRTDLGTQVGPPAAPADLPFAVPFVPGPTSLPRAGGRAATVPPSPGGGSAPPPTPSTTPTPQPTACPAPTPTPVSTPTPIVSPPPISPTPVPLPSPT